MKKRGEIEVWLKRIFFGMNKDKYYVVIKHRVGGIETYRSIPFTAISDVRGGYIIVGEDCIPFHRVVEIRSVDEKIVYSRLKLDPST